MKRSPPMQRDSMWSAIATPPGIDAGDRLPTSHWRILVGSMRIVNRETASSIMTALPSEAGQAQPPAPDQEDDLRPRME